MRISGSHFAAACPGADGLIVNAILLNWALAEQYGITDQRQTAFFLGNCAVESRGFTRLEESLYYTTAARLKAVWPTRFKSDTAGTPYLRNPEKLANAVYSNRMGNGDEASGDGWKYRGSGLMQTTGRDNFAAVQKATGLPVLDNPELLRSMPHALEAACIFWKKNNLGKFAAAGDVVGITKAIQGGTGGLSERRLYISRFMAALRPVTSTDRPTLKRGASSPFVTDLQTMLHKLGFYDGKLDGIFGHGTENAVSDFQETYNVRPVDGVVGPLTYTAIDERLSSHE